MGAHRPWAYPCDRSHGCHLFQRSHNSLTLRQVLSVSENDGSHKRALIDRKGKPRVYMDYCSIRLTLFWYADVSDCTHSYSAVLTLSFRPHPHFHSAAPTLPFGRTHSSIRPHPLFHSVAPTLSFGCTHSSIRLHPLCHPDRSGGISSSWHKTLLIHSDMQVWVLVCRRSFGCAQDDRLGCHSAAPTLPFGRTHSFIRLHPLFHSAAPTLPFGCTHSVIPTVVEGSHLVGTRRF